MKRTTKLVGAAAIIGASIVFAMPANASQPGILCVQNELYALGYITGVPDGSFGPRTSEAAEEYRLWMLYGGGGDGWNDPPLSAFNGEKWCSKVAQDHPSVTRFVDADVPSVSYAASGRDGLVATFDVPLDGRIVGWELSFVFKTECENDHWASIEGPAGELVVVMDRGLHRCSGTPQTFTGTSKNAPPLLGAQSEGQWQLVFKDLDANLNSGFLMQAQLKLTVVTDGVISKQVIRFDGLPKAIPTPT